MNVKYEYDLFLYAITSVRFASFSVFMSLTSYLFKCCIVQCIHLWIIFWVSSLIIVVLHFFFFLFVFFYCSFWTLTSLGFLLCLCWFHIVGWVFLVHYGSRFVCSHATDHPFLLFLIHLLLCMLGRKTIIEYSIHCIFF